VKKVPVSVISEQASEILSTLRDLQEKRMVPLGLFSYDVENERFLLCVFNGNNLDEVDALMRKLNLKVEYPARKR
jgi:hypothetical protein